MTPDDDLIADLWNELFEYEALRTALASMSEAARSRIRGEWLKTLAYYIKDIDSAAGKKDAK